MSRPIVLILLGASLLLPAFAARSQPCCSIQGTVLDASGQPVPAVWVVVERDGREMGRSLTGDDGRYYLEDLEAGSYRITVRRRDEILFQGAVRLPENSRFDVRLG